MNAQDLLSLLLYLGDKISLPTLANLCAGYEEFEYRTGLLPAMRRWEEGGLIQRAGTARQVVYRLTNAGRRRLEPFGDPEEFWKRGWDGLWRAFLFDLPSSEHRLRMMLWRWLREHRFGYLQDSVWVRPDPVSELVETLEWFRENPENFVVLEARTIKGGSDAALVKGAWDFAKINAGYRRYLASVDSCQEAVAKPIRPAELAALVRRERTAYVQALAIDPLLPKRLLPPDYLGRKAYEAHRRFGHAVHRRVQRL